MNTVIQNQKKSDVAAHLGISEQAELVDLDEFEFTSDSRKLLREIIREVTLAHVNENSKQVKPVESFYTKYGKRCIDFIAALFVLLITSPLNLILMVCTFFDVGNPIIFRQKRVGMGEKEFELVKFRNMTNATDKNGELLPPKDRVTKFGKWVRKTSLDELLNFWSILKGDMSLIGPRPLVGEYQGYMSDRHRMRSAVRPGLECPMLLEGERSSSWTDQFENDVYYVEHVSLGTDLKCMCLLVKMVFDRKSSAIRGNARRGSFMGYDMEGNTINSMSVPVEFIRELKKRQSK